MKEFCIDKDTPLCPEIIADMVSQDRIRQDFLCERARHFWKTNEGFRNSFKRKDGREVLLMWFNHWNEGQNKRAKL